MRRLWMLSLPLLLTSLATAQPPAAEPLTKIAFGSCADQFKPQPIWNAVAALHPQVFISLGDNIYADTSDMEVMKAKYGKLAAQPGFQKVKASCKILATWDDHDYGLNDAGVEYTKKKESQQLFLDFFGVPADSPRRQQEGIYFSEIHGPPGKRVQFILLDTRYFRSPLKKAEPPRPKDVGPYIPNEDPAATLLGEAQWKWLAEQLKVPAEVRIIGSSIQVIAQDHGWEKWWNTPLERDRLFKLIKETKAGGVIFLSGDRHLAEISMMDAGIGYPLYDVTSSGMTEAFKVWRPLEPNKNRVGTMNFGDNFGLVSIDWHKPDPVISLQIRDVDGDVRLCQKLKLSTINPFMAETTASKEPPPPAGVHTPADAAQKVGQTVTVEFVVKATGGNDRVFLNSEADYRSEKNFTVVLEKAVLKKVMEEKKIDDAKSYFRDKRIRVTGKIDLFQGKAQIKVAKAEDLVVVE